MYFPVFIVSVCLRITGAYSDQEGNVEAYINNLMIFLDINKDNEQNVSKVICRTLGLPPPIMFFKFTKSVYIKNFKDKLKVKLRCTGKEPNISECKTRFYTTWFPFGRLHGVSCRKGRLT